MSSGFAALTLDNRTSDHVRLVIGEAELWAASARHTASPVSRHEPEQPTQRPTPRHQR